MPIPSQDEMCEPLLYELLQAGGSARPRDIYEKVAAHFNLTPEERAEELPKAGHNKFENRLQWARQSLVARGMIDGSVRGVWTLTESGRRAMNAGEAPNAPTSALTPIPSPLTLMELIDSHDTGIRDRLREQLRSLDPYQFEDLAGDLLRAMGFREVQVTQRSNDGGIDGMGRLKLGIVTVNAAFQCKKWANVVGRPEIDRFRGATQGRFDQAIFMTTSSFSAQAAQESIRAGTIPVILVDGNQMIQLMIEHGIGITRQPLTIPQIDEEFFNQLTRQPADDED